MAYQFLVLELVKAEAVAFFQVVVIMLYIRYDTFAYLQLHVLGRRVFLFVFVYCFKVLPYDGAFGYYICAEEDVMIEISAAEIM